MTGLQRWSVSEDEGGLTIIDSPVGTICVLTEGTRAQQNARAHLIASAPDLRDALQELASVAALVDARAMVGLEISPHNRRRLAKAVIAGRDALRRAVGLAP